jgi:hypothetical protein
MLVTGTMTNGESIDGRPPRRGWRRRRIEAAGSARLGDADGRAHGRWSRAALQEAAAAVAFEQLRLELRAIGAPTELVDRAGVAAEDERRHAARCRALAHVAGEEPGDGPMAVPVLEPPRDCRSRASRYVRIAQIAAESRLDGSLNERRAAHRIRGAAATSSAPVGPLLAAIADDEDRHAALADDIVGWARADGGRLTAMALAVLDWRSRHDRSEEAERSVSAAHSPVDHLQPVVPEQHQDHDDRTN